MKRKHQNCAGVQKIQFVYYFFGLNCETIKTNPLNDIITVSTYHALQLFLYFNNMYPHMMLV